MEKQKILANRVLSSSNQWTFRVYWLHIENSIKWKLSNCNFTNSYKIIINYWLLATFLVFIGGMEFVIKWVSKHKEKNINQQSIICRL